MWWRRYRRRPSTLEREAYGRIPDYDTVFPRTFPLLAVLGGHVRPRR